MPNRMLRDWTGSDKVNSLSVYAERFFTRLIMKADDYGCFYADTRLLKANLFPLLLDKIREADMLRWMAECQKAGLIVLYEHEGKKYVQIQDFRQRLDKARSKFPLPTTENQKTNEEHRVVNEVHREVELENEVEKKTNGAKALVVASATGQRGHTLKKKYVELIETLSGQDIKTVWGGLKGFIVNEHPEFIEPYHEAWNLFATTYKLSKVENISSGRLKKFKTRMNERGFDFLKVLEKIRESHHLKGDNQRGWKVTFDWIFENDQNYLKIIEGQYE